MIYNCDWKIINLYHKGWQLKLRNLNSSIQNKHIQCLRDVRICLPIVLQIQWTSSKANNFWYISPVSSGTKVATVLVNINLMRCLPWEVFVIPNKQNNNVPTIFCSVLINDTCVWYHFRMTLTFLPSGIKSKYADSKLNRLIDCHCSTKTQWLTR